MSTLSKTFFETHKSVEEICDVVHRMTNNQNGDKYLIVKRGEKRVKESDRYKFVELYVLLNPCSVIKINLLAGSSSGTIRVETEKRYGSTMMLLKFSELLDNLVNFSGCPELSSISLVDRYADLLTDEHNKHVLMNLIDDFHDSPMVHGMVYTKIGTIANEHEIAFLVFESARGDAIVVK